MPPHLHGEDAEGMFLSVTSGNVHRFPWAAGNDAQILIVQMGSKSTPTIKELLMKIGFRSRVVGWRELPDVWARQDLKPNLVILSGGEQSVYDPDAPGMSAELFRAIIRESVILGICYGAQLLAQLGGGEVRKAAKPEVGMVDVRVKSPLGHYKGGTVVMNHGDEIVRMPADWKVVGSTQDCAHALCVSPRAVAVQFHPEMDHTEGGNHLLKYVAKAIADCRTDFSFQPSTFITEAGRWLRETIPTGHVVCGASAGVDSTSALLIGRQAYGTRIHGVYVDNGLMREGETDEARGIYGAAGMTYVDAREVFYDALEAIPYPADGRPAQRESAYFKEVRAVVGKTFIEVFARQTRVMELPFRALMQGTNRADIVESETGLKAHHNVGALPLRLMEEFGLDVIEPLADLFKYQVREVAEALGLPEEVARRQPFPGPGLSLRLWGKIDRSIFPPLARANRILHEVVVKHYPAFNRRPHQYYAAFMPLPSVGIMGDGRVSGYGWWIRLVSARNRENYSSIGNFLASAKFYAELTQRLTTETRMPDGTPFIRVAQEMTPKPPSTTELH
ncbi:hypothetical protein EPO33_00745 [Patescibacteria group bacterium]|nr:MAG: hypothetical protein EPO33_00745 [Patescibacteria group bacterium]